MRVLRNTRMGGWGLAVDILNDLLYNSFSAIGAVALTFGTAPVIKGYGGI